MALNHLKKDSISFFAAKVLEYIQQTTISVRFRNLPPKTGESAPWWGAVETQLDLYSVLYMPL